MPRFASYDGTQLSFRLLGDGPPLVCLPGGPGRAVDYLGDLGGLDAGRQLVLLDPRGVGASADAADPATLRVDRLVQDVESLRSHLGLEQLDLLAHSAGAVLATLYAATHTDRLARLILVTPGLAAVGVHATEAQMLAALRRSSAEPWYPTASAALEKIMAGDLSIDAYRASRPFFYGRWGEAARAHATVGIAARHRAARDGYFAGLDLDLPATRVALARLTAPVLLYGGEMDPMVMPALLEQAAPAFPDATVVVQPAAAHFPWVDDAAAFSAAVSAFVGSAT